MQTDDVDDGFVVHRSVASVIHKCIIGTRINSLKFSFNETIPNAIIRWKINSDTLVNNLSMYTEDFI